MQGRPAAKSGRLDIGDELLAVNDWECTGSDVTDVVSKILGPMGMYEMAREENHARHPRPTLGKTRMRLCMAGRYSLHAHWWQDPK